MINSVFKSEEVDRIAKIFGFLPTVYDLCFSNEKGKETIFEIFLFDQLDFEEEDIFKALIRLYREVQQN